MLITEADLPRVLAMLGGGAELPDAQAVLTTSDTQDTLERPVTHDLSDD